jgi:ribonuclease HI
MKRLNWFRRSTLWPPLWKVKDLDVIQDILWKASRRGQRIVVVKVSGHTGDPLHSEADIEAGAAAEDDLAETVCDAELACVPRIGFGDEHLIYGLLQL